MLIALNFTHNGQRKGIWVESEELEPEVWQKLRNNLVKQSLGSRWIHVASEAQWSTQLNRDGHIFRPSGATRFLTGKPLEVSEPTIEGVLAAIDADERKRLAVPLEPRPPRNVSCVTEEAKLLLGT